jgi:hypothetical protein
MTLRKESHIGNAALMADMMETNLMSKRGLA